MKVSLLPEDLIDLSSGQRKEKGVVCSFSNRKEASIAGTWQPMCQRVAEMGPSRQVAETTPDLLARVLGLDFVLNAMGNFRVMMGI